MQKFLANDKQLLTVAAHWWVMAHFEGRRLPLITKEFVAAAIRKFVGDVTSPSAQQEAFVSFIFRAITMLDERMFRGNWKMMRATPSNPFILGDAPVITWVRSASGAPFYGLGFHTPDVEVALPISPLSCIHIAPAVERTRPLVEPRIQEINIGEAAFAYEACFADQKGREIDEIVQKFGGSVKIGLNAFTLGHKNYDNIFFDVLMQQW